MIDEFSQIVAWYHFYSANLGCTQVQMLIFVVK
jgi:hypothetical protein